MEQRDGTKNYSHGGANERHASWRGTLGLICVNLEVKYTYYWGFSHKNLRHGGSHGPSTPPSSVPGGACLLEIGDWHEELLDLVLCRKGVCRAPQIMRHRLAEPLSNDYAMPLLSLAMKAHPQLVAF